MIGRVYFSVSEVYGNNDDFMKFNLTELLEAVGDKYGEFHYVEGTRSYHKHKIKKIIVEEANEIIRNIHRVHGSVQMQNFGSIRQLEALLNRSTAGKPKHCGIYSFIYLYAIFTILGKGKADELNFDFYLDTYFQLIDDFCEHSDGSKTVKKLANYTYHTHGPINHAIHSETVIKLTGDDFEPTTHIF